MSDNKDNKQKNGFFGSIRTLLPAVALALAAMYILNLGPFSNERGLNENQTIIHTGEVAESLNYSVFYDKLNDDELSSISYQVGSSDISGVDKNGVVYHTVVPYGSEIIKDAREKGITVEISKPKVSILQGPFGTLIIFLLPVVLLISFLFWAHKKQSSEMKNITKPDLSKLLGDDKDFINPEENKSRLADVAGCDEAKKEVAEIIDFLKNPEVYSRVGAKSPKGVLMSGPPGTGKTLLAKAIAGEAEVPFFSTSGSDFVQMFVGVGASRVREIFAKAKNHAPAIIFIDEIDAVGRQRTGGGYASNEEREQTLISLLTEMDGFSPNSNVVVIASTNRPDVLDEALLRPGRFDREVTLTNPDKQGRIDILKVHSKSVPVSNDVDWEKVAAASPGFSGADLANLVNEAAILAARERESLINMKHFEEARDKVLMGVQKGSMKNEYERKIVAYHEAGHAIVARFTDGSEPVHKISIIPRGRALGVMMQLPKEDSYNHSRKKLFADISVLMGGRAAEDVALDECTVGASNDFMRATVLARRMIASWGMDKDFGPFSVDGERGDEWAGRDAWSEKTKEDVDAKVQNILKTYYENARNILTDNRDILEAVAKALLDKETLDADEFESIVLSFQNGEEKINN